MGTPEKWFRVVGLCERRRPPLDFGLSLAPPGSQARTEIARTAPAERIEKKSGFRRKIETKGGARL
jgi:hypothetical protein